MSVAPGATETPVLTHAGLSREQIADNEKEISARIPLGRIAQPEEIAWWVAEVTLPAAGYVTGAVVRVDGGLNIA